MSSLAGAPGLNFIFSKFSPTLLAIACLTLVISFSDVSNPHHLYTVSFASVSIISFIILSFNKPPNFLTNSSTKSGLFTFSIINLAISSFFLPKILNAGTPPLDGVTLSAPNFAAMANCAAANFCFVPTPGHSTCLASIVPSVAMQKIPDHL